MSQRASVESSTAPSPTQSINPVLQAALGSLDVQMEEELIRYRRQKAGRPVSPTNGLKRQQTRKSLELISVTNIDSQTQRPSLKMAASITAALPAASESPTISAETTDTSRSLPPQLSLVKHPEEATDNQTSETTSSEALTATQTNLVDPKAAQPEIDDYLASSEELLRSLTDREADLQTERGLLDNVLTPLGVGSMLLLLFSSVSMGYLLMNPGTLSNLGLDRFWKPKTPTVAQNSPTPAVNPKTEVAQIPNGPNLAAEEFVELNLNNLSTLKTSPSSSPLPKSTVAPSVSAKPVPSVATNSNLNNLPSSSGLASALLPGAVQVVPGQANSSVPAIPNNSVQSSPNAGSKPNTAASPGVAVSLNSSPSPANLTKFRKDFYYVLTSYEGDRVLTQAKTIISDAYLVNLQEGTRIQMGAYPKESQAKKVVEQLQQKGISAWVYHP